MDQFRRLRPGEPLPGIYTQPWNKMLEGLKAGPGLPPDRSHSTTAIEFPVHNGTGSPVFRFRVLRVGEPFTTFGKNADLFFSEDALRGTTPAPGKPFVVVQEPITAGGIGTARILGRTDVRVNLLDTSHEFAGPGTTVDELVSATTGPARILWLESEEAGVGSGSGSGSGVAETGSQWAVVLLGGGGAGGGGDVELIEVTGTGSGSGSGSCLDPANILAVDPDTCTSAATEAILFIDANTIS